MRETSGRKRGGAHTKTDADSIGSVQRAHEVLTAIIENSPVAIITLDPDQRVMTCNPAAERLFGWDAKEILGHPYPLIPAEAQPEFDRLWAGLKAGESVTDREVVRRHRDGRALDVSLSVARLHDSAGRVTGFLGMMVDITERRKAESEREHSLSLLRAALESTEDGLLVLDPDGRAVVVNKRFVEMWRVPADAGIGQDVRLRAWLLSLVEDPEGFERNGQELLDHPHREQYDLLKLRDGRLFERYSRPQMIAGRPVGRVFSFRDVTHRTRAEQAIRTLNQELEKRVQDRTSALAEANAKLRRRMRELRALNGMAAAVTMSLSVTEQLEALAEHLSRDLQVPGGMLFVVTPETGVPQMERCWGIPEDLAAKLAADPAAMPGLKQCIRRRHLLRQRNGDALESEEDRDCPRELDMDRPTIVPVIARLQVQAVMVLWNWRCRDFAESDIRVFRSLGKQVALAVEDARLYTELRSSHERLQGLSRKVVDVQEQERRHIARELHDEIGQTLTGVKLSLEMLHRDPERQPEALDQAQRLVNELMARVRELSLALRPAMLDDLGLLPALLWLMDSYSRQTGVRVDFEHQGETPRLPQQIETAVYRIVQEALTNVARHAETRHARVSLRYGSDTVYVGIEDHGRGFDIEAITEPVDSMGLPGMMERATLLGGKLELTSAPGEGTRISAALPLVTDDADTAEAAVLRGHSSNMRGMASGSGRRGRRNGGSDDNNSAG